MFDIGVPYRAAELAHAMQALQAQGTELSRRFSLGSFFAPQGTAWSPADQIRHLRKTTLPISLAFYLPSGVLALGFGRGAGASRPYDQIRDAYRASLTKSTSAGIFAPRPDPEVPDPARRREAILNAWHVANHRFAAAVGRWSEAELDRYRLPHPRLGTLTLREMAAFTVYHTEHHLARIIERAGQYGFGGS